MLFCVTQRWRVIAAVGDIHLYVCLFFSFFLFSYFLTHMSSIQPLLAPLSFSLSFLLNSNTQICIYLSFFRFLFFHFSSSFLPVAATLSSVGYGPTFDTIVLHKFLSYYTVCHVLPYIFMQCECLGILCRKRIQFLPFFILFSFCFHFFFPFIFSILFSPSLIIPQWNFLAVKILIHPKILEVFIFTLLILCPTVRMLDVRKMSQI